MSTNQSHMNHSDDVSPMEIEEASDGSNETIKSAPSNVNHHATRTTTTTGTQSPNSPISTTGQTQISTNRQTNGTSRIAPILPNTHLTASHDLESTPPDRTSIPPPGQPTLEHMRQESTGGTSDSSSDDTSVESNPPPIQPHSPMDTIEPISSLTPPAPVESADGDAIMNDVEPTISNNDTNTMPSSTTNLPQSSDTAAAASDTGASSSGGVDRSGWYGLCEILFKKGPKYAGKYLAQRVEQCIREGRNVSECILPYFLKHFFLMAHTCQLGNICVSDWCLYLLCGGGPPGDFLRQFRERLSTTANHGQTMCAKFLVEGDYVYSCRTCQIGSTSVICPQCFQEGHHEGHDYTLQVSGGGTCDCGDVGWKSCGMCDTHRQNQLAEQQAQQQRILKEELNALQRNEEYVTTEAFRYRIRVVISSLVSFVCTSIHALQPFPTDLRRFTSVLKVLGWMKKLCKTSSVGTSMNEFSQAFGDALCAPFETQISTTLYNSEYLNQVLLKPPPPPPPSNASSAATSTSATTPTNSLVPPHPITRLHYLLHFCFEPLPNFSPTRLDRLIAELCYALVLHQDFKRALAFAMISPFSIHPTSTQPYPLYRRMLIGQCTLPLTVHAIILNHSQMSSLIAEQSQVVDSMLCNLRDLFIVACHMRGVNEPTLNIRSYQHPHQFGPRTSFRLSPDFTLDQQTNIVSLQQQVTQAHLQLAQQRMRNTQLTQHLDQVMERLGGVEALPSGGLIEGSVASPPPPAPATAFGGAHELTRTRSNSSGVSRHPSLPTVHERRQTNADTTNAAPARSSSSASPPPSTSPTPPLPSDSAAAASGMSIDPPPQTLTATQLFGPSLPSPWSSNTLFHQPNLNDQPSTGPSPPTRMNQQSTNSMPSIWFYNRQHSLSYILSGANYDYRVNRWNERCLQEAEIQDAPPSAQALMRLQVALGLPIRPLTLDASSPIVSNHIFLQLKNDLMTLLDHAEVCRKTLLTSTTVTRFLSLCSLFQSMNPQKRKLGAHVSFEKTDSEMKNYFYLEIIIHKAFERLLKKGMVPVESPNTTGSSSSSLVLPPTSPYSSIHHKGPGSYTPLRRRDSITNLHGPTVSSPSVPLRSPYQVQEHLRTLLQTNANPSEVSEAEEALRTCQHQRGGVVRRIALRPPSPLHLEKQQPGATVAQTSNEEKELVKLVARPLPPRHSCPRCVVYANATIPSAHLTAMSHLIHNFGNHLVFDFIGQHLPITESSLFQTPLSAMFHPIMCRVVNSSVSIHQPLHRMFARIIAYCLTYFPSLINRSPDGRGLDDLVQFNSNLNDIQYEILPSQNQSHLTAIRSSPLSFWLCYLESPLRLTVFMSQLRSKSLWIRNGFDTITHMQKNYKNTSNFWRRGFGNDLCGMQIAAVEIMHHTAIEADRQLAGFQKVLGHLAAPADGADLFVQRLVERFDVQWWIPSGVEDLFGETPSLPTTICPFTTTESITLAEDFFKLIHGLVCDRSYYVCDLSVLKCFIIHILIAYGSQITHSQIIQFLPTESAQTQMESIDAILSEVANFIPPPINPTSSSAAKCGVYQLKPQYWSYSIAPSLYWKYSSQEMILAEEKLREWRRKQEDGQRKRNVIIEAANHFLKQQEAKSIVDGIGTSSQGSNVTDIKLTSPTDSTTIVPSLPYFDSLIQLLHTPTLHTFMFTVLSLALRGSPESTTSPAIQPKQIKVESASNAEEEKSSSSSVASVSVDPAIVIAPPQRTLSQSSVASNGGGGAGGGGGVGFRAVHPQTKSMAPGPDLPVDRLTQQALQMLALALTYSTETTYSSVIQESNWPHGFHMQPSGTHLTPLMWNENEADISSMPSGTPVSSSLIMCSSGRLGCLVSLVEQLFKRGHMLEFSLEMKNIFLLAQIRLGRPIAPNAFPSLAAANQPTTQDSHGLSSSILRSSSVGGGSKGTRLDARAVAKQKAKHRQQKLLARMTSEQYQIAKHLGVNVETTAPHPKMKKSKSSKRESDSTAPYAQTIVKALSTVVEEKSQMDTTATTSQQDESAKNESIPVVASSAVPPPLLSPPNLQRATSESTFEHARCCLCHEGADSKSAETQTSATSSLMPPEIAKVLGMVCFLTPTGLSVVSHRAQNQQLSHRVASAIGVELPTPTHSTSSNSHHIISADGFLHQPLGSLELFHTMAQQMTPSEAFGEKHKSKQRVKPLNNNTTPTTASNANNLAPPTLGPSNLTIPPSLAMPSIRRTTSAPNAPVNSTTTSTSAATNTSTAAATGTTATTASSATTGSGMPPRPNAKRPRASESNLAVPSTAAAASNVTTSLTAAAASSTIGGNLQPFSSANLPPTLSIPSLLPISDTNTHPVAAAASTTSTTADAAVTSDTTAEGDFGGLSRPVKRRRRSGTDIRTGRSGRPTSAAAAATMMTVPEEKEREEKEMEEKKEENVNMEENSEQVTSPQRRLTRRTIDTNRFDEPFTDEPRLSPLSSLGLSMPPMTRTVTQDIADLLVEPNDPMWTGSASPTNISPNPSPPPSPPPQPSASSRRRHSRHRATTNRAMDETMREVHGTNGPSSPPQPMEEDGAAQLVVRDVTMEVMREQRRRALERHRTARPPQTTNGTGGGAGGEPAANDVVTTLVLERMDSRGGTDVTTHVFNGGANVPIAGQPRPQPPQAMTNHLAGALLNQVLQNVFQPANSPMAAAGAPIVQQLPHPQHHNQTQANTRSNGTQQPHSSSTATASNSQHITFDWSHSLGLHLQTCNKHYIHIGCLETYLSSKYGRSQTGGWRQGSTPFLCPVCRRLSNVIIPIGLEQQEEIKPIPESTTSTIAAVIPKRRLPPPIQFCLPTTTITLKHRGRNMSTPDISELNATTIDGQSTGSPQLNPFIPPSPLQSPLPTFQFSSVTNIFQSQPTASESSRGASATSLDWQKVDSWLYWVQQQSQTTPLATTLSSTSTVDSALLQISRSTPSPAFEPPSLAFLSVIKHFIHIVTEMLRGRQTASQSPSIATNVFDQGQLGVINWPRIQPPPIRTQPVQMNDAPPVARMNMSTDALTPPTLANVSGQVGVAATTQTSPAPSPAPIPPTTPAAAASPASIVPTPLSAAEPANMVPPEIDLDGDVPSPSPPQPILANTAAVGTAAPVTAAATHLTNQIAAREARIEGLFQRLQDAEARRRDLQLLNQQSRNELQQLRQMLFTQAPPDPNNPMVASFIVGSPELQQPPLMQPTPNMHISTQLFSPASMIAYMRIFLCIMGNTANIWELSIREQFHTPTESIKPTLTSLALGASSQTIFGFVPHLPSLFSSHATSLSSFYQSIPHYLDHRQQKVFKQLLMLYRLTRQHWLKLIHQTPTTTGTTTANSSTVADSTTNASTMIDPLDDPLFLWQMFIGHESTESLWSKSRGPGKTGVAHANHQAMTLPLLSRNMFSVLVQFTPILLRLTNNPEEPTSMHSIELDAMDLSADGSTITNSSDPSSPSALDHALSILRIFYLAVIAQSVTYVSSLGVPSSESVDSSNSKELHERVNESLKRKAMAATNNSTNPTAAANADSERPLKKSRGETMLLDKDMWIDECDISYCLTDPPVHIIDEDGVLPLVDEPFDVNRANDVNYRTTFWQRASERFLTHSPLFTPSELLLSSACISDCTSIPSLLLFTRAVRLRLIDLTMPYDLHLKQQRERQDAIRAILSHLPRDQQHWTSLTQQLNHAQIQAAVQQLTIPFIRQSALYLSAISHIPPVNGDSAQRTVFDFNTIFPPLQSTTSNAASLFYLGPSSQRLIYFWYQGLFLPVWAKRAMAAGCNQGRVVIKTRLPPTVVSSMSNALSPPPFALSPTKPTRPSSAASLLSPTLQVPTGAAVTTFNLASPPRLLSSIPREAPVASPTALSNRAISTTQGTNLGSIAGAGETRWTLSSFTPFTPPPATTTISQQTEGGSSTPAANAASTSSQLIPLPRTPTMKEIPSTSTLVPTTANAHHRPTLSLLSPFPCVSGDVGDQFAFSGLPQQFHSFFTSGQIRACSECRQRKHALNTSSGAQNLAVCLLCGAYVCLTGHAHGHGHNNSSGQPPQKCYLHHLTRCDGRIGLYLMLKRGGEVLCLIYSSGGTASCFWPSLYLDRYGESDHGLHRGRPLYLHQGRLQTLTHMYTNMALQDYITNHSQQIITGPGGGAMNQPTATIGIGTGPTITIPG